MSRLGASVDAVEPSHVRSNELARDWPVATRLFVISVLTLYFELLIIRWLPTEIRVLAYFSNFTLISCVLGMGLGALIAHRGKYRAEAFPLWLAALMSLAYAYHGLNISLPIATSHDFIWNGLSRMAQGTPLQYVALGLFLSVNTLAFVPLGRMLGRELDRLPAIRAYTINVAGALAGVALFAAFSYARVPPLGWHLCGLALLVPLLPLNWLSGMGVALCLALAVLGNWEADTYWSPYYKIQVQNMQGGAFSITVNDDSHQSTVSRKLRPDDPALAVYDMPYRFGRSGDVLVVGAGSGNDVAAALHAGARSVHAVEIDPVILELGARHPDRPYADPRVRQINRDARAYVNHTTKRFDHIVMGYLDSHALFSAMSSVRLDNFVYTLEFMRALRRHLTPEGVLSLTFTVHERWIAERLYALLQGAFGYPPLVYDSSSQNAAVYLIGEPVRRFKPEYLDYHPAAAARFTTWRLSMKNEGYLSPLVFSRVPAYQLPVDDWPYLYLRDREIPPSYMLSLVLMLGLALAFVHYKAGGLRSIDAHFFLLGAGFLLIETKAMTELAMFLGSTWIVNASVIAMILSLILAGNWLASLPFCPSTRATYAALAMTIVGSYLMPVGRLMEWQSELRSLVAVVVLCLPLFFAAIIFARQMRVQAHPSTALGSNLMGALVGGALEYCSMAYGFSALYLLALGVYVLAFLVLSRRGSAALSA